MRKLPITAAILLCTLITPAFCDPQAGEARTWDGANVHEFNITNPEAIHKYCKSRRVKYSIGDKSWHGTLVIHPFVYKTAGKKAPIPE